MIQFSHQFCRFISVFVFKIYLDTVTIQQLQLIFNGPCYYNKDIKFTTNVKPTYWSASRYQDRYLLQFFQQYNYITKY
jgi:hypothetical protein